MYKKHNIYHIRSENTPGELTQAELTQGRLDSGADLTPGRVDPLPSSEVPSYEA